MSNPYRAPKSFLPSTWSSVLLRLAAVLWVLGASSAPVQAQFLSPGPLAAAHAKWEGDTQCETCHSAGRGVPNSKCNACHQPIARSQARRTGLHGRKFNGQPCARCHSDHHGRNFAMIRWDPKALNHGDTGWPLRGTHSTTACAKCHETKSYIGLSQACTSCHKDPHANRFGSKCLGCHDETAWTRLEIESFDHNLTRFALKGAHATTSCDECHRGNPPKYAGLEFSRCTSCHKDPHRGGLGPTCGNCHSEVDWHRVTFKPGAHPWLSLGNGHARTGCAQCHDRGTLRSPSRGRACVGCHEPVHDADFGKVCENCHAPIKWLGLPRKVGLSAHPKTDYPLEGQHVEVPCGNCHKPALAEEQRFRGLAFERCDSCHTDAHAGRFERRDRGECGSCHGPSGFRPSLFGLSLHATTRFALVGRHAAVPCSTCHQSTGRQKRRLDWSLDKLVCANCHENPHGTQFAEEMQNNGCASCHTPADWDVPNIDHSIWPLTGAHASTPCGACHTPTESDKKAGQGPSYRLAPRECEGCHEDVHLGQFRLSSPVRNCDFCHATSEFSIRDFAHETLAGYPLEGRHKALECLRCHDSQKVPGGKESVRYRLGYRRCRDCHADPHARAVR